MLAKSEIHQVIRSALALPEDYPLADDNRPAFVPGWDSMGWLQVIAALEERGNAEVPLESLDDVVTIGEFCDVIGKIGAK